MGQEFHPVWLLARELLSREGRLRELERLSARVVALFFNSHPASHLADLFSVLVSSVDALGGKLQVAGF